MSAGFNGEVIAQDTGESSHVILSEFLTGQLKFVGLIFSRAFS